MLMPGQMTAAFQPYWDEIDRCRQAKTYSSLLHVTVCLPDICAALESQNGETSAQLYKAWCDKYLTHPNFLSAERYRMRCKVLHQGRAATDQAGRYTGFAFGQPSDTGHADHMRIEANVLHLDVGELSRETKSAIESWIRALEANATSPEATNVERNITSLVRVSKTQVQVFTPAPPGTQPMIVTINKTN